MQGGGSIFVLSVKRFNAPTQPNPPSQLRNANTLHRPPMPFNLAKLLLKSWAKFRLQNRGLMVSHKHLQ